MAQVTEAAAKSVKDVTRAVDIMRIRLLFKKGTPQREPVDVNEVVREMIALLRGEAPRHGISVRMQLAGDLPVIFGDRVQVQQVLMNLIVNSASNRTADRPMVSTSVPRQQADQIFNAFFTTKVHGTGMGLSISRSIVQSHGGRLWAEDNSPRGASFHVTLPIRVDTHESVGTRFNGLHRR